MVIQTKAIILNSLKYGDTSAILTCFSQDLGYKSFIAKGVFSKRNKIYPYLLTLNEIEIFFYKNPKNSLEIIKSVNSVKNNHNLLYNDIQKSCILTFIAEVLNQVLKKETNPNLYKYITKSLQLFVLKQEFYADFHVYFLLKLSHFLGFYPLPTHSCYMFFDKTNGRFSNHRNNSEEIPNGSLWKKLLEYDFTQANNCFSFKERKQMLNELLTFYELHIDSFRRPVSLEVLKTVFSI